jgi:hypothetical protein
MSVEQVGELGDGRFHRVRSPRLTNLSIPVTPFVGRERKLAEVVETICLDDARLLTLTGAQLALGSRRV